MMPAARFLSDTIPTSSGAFEAYVAHPEPMLVALKTGTHSPWASRGVKNAGHELIVANARQVTLIQGSKHMSMCLMGSWGIGQRLSSRWRPFGLAAKSCRPREQRVSTKPSTTQFAPDEVLRPQRSVASPAVQENGIAGCRSNTAMEAERRILKHRPVA